MVKDRKEPNIMKTCKSFWSKFYVALALYRSFCPSFLLSSSHTLEVVILSIKLLIKQKRSKIHMIIPIYCRTYLSRAEDVLAAAETIATKGIPELIETDKNGCSNTFPTLTKASFPVYYRVVFVELVNCVKGINVGKQSDSREVLY